MSPRPIPAPRSRRALLAAALVPVVPVVPVVLGALVALGATACRSQRWPKPMVDTVRPLPPGDVSPYDPGPSEAIVFRHGDPVQVRRAGTRAGYPLTYYDKRARVLSGGWMLVGPGGRGEVFWPDNGTVAVFFEQGAGRIGEPTRGEPDLEVHDLTSLRLTLGAGARVRLPGGAELSADPVAGGGPYDVRRVDERLLRIRNQSKTSVDVLYRHEPIQLGPGEVIDLAVLQSGDGALPPIGEEWTAEDHVLVRGDVERLAVEGGGPGDRTVGVRAVGEAELVGQGVRVHLAPGETATFRGLGDPARGFQRKGPATDDPTRDDLRIPRIQPLPLAPPPDDAGAAGEAVEPGAAEAAGAGAAPPAVPPAGEAPEGAEAAEGAPPMIPAPPAETEPAATPETEAGDTPEEGAAGEETGPPDEAAADSTTDSAEPPGADPPPPAEASNDPSSR